MTSDMDEYLKDEYKAKSETKKNYWLIELIDKRKGTTKAVVQVDKNEFPSKKAALAYLTQHYDTRLRTKKNTIPKMKRSCGCK